eukprot:6214752-Pleurochrysis_carterae.AAC.5
MFDNVPVDWSSRLLKVAASFCLAKTTAGFVAAKRSTFLLNLLGHFLDAIGNKLNGGATVLLMVNIAAFEQADRASASKKRTEHYKCSEYSVRKLQLDGLFKAHFSRTRNQVADCLAKVRQDHVPQAAPASDFLNTGAPPVVYHEPLCIKLLADLTQLFEADGS